jgi:diguanylate cyclase
MSDDKSIKEFHWLMDMIQSVDVGLVVLDKKYQVKVWNSFMENHSNLSSEDVRGKDLFSLFQNTSTGWMKKKVDSVFMLNNRAFSTWEQRPYLFKFNNYRPITGTETYMYQNISIIPLCSTTGEVESVCMIIYDVTDIASQRKELHVANEQLQSLSRTDAMTGLNNRGFWQECLNNEFKRFCRNPQPRTLVIFDIDHFKKVNDTYGHHVGDEIIKGVSEIFLQTQRDTDISGRYGGEEFVIILTNVKETSAKIFSERLRKKVEEFVYVDEEIDLEVKVTISLGLAELSLDDKDPTQWLNRADTALYEAKNAGRNQSVLYSSIKNPDQ